MEAGLSAYYTFQGGSDGSMPNGGLIFDQAGNLYGVTQGDGGVGECTTDEFGCGNGFRTDPQWEQLDGKRSLQFPCNSLLCHPADLCRGGHLFGATLDGWNSNCIYGCGAVFEMTPKQRKLTLKSDLTIHRRN